jgi:hypothetical protein
MIFSIHQFERSAKPSLSPQMAAIFMSPPEKSQASSRGNKAKLIHAGRRQMGAWLGSAESGEVTNMI